VFDSLPFLGFRIKTPLRRWEQTDMKRSIRRAFALVMVLGGCVSGFLMGFLGDMAQVEAQVTLVRKYVEGDTSSESIDTSLKQTLVINGANVDTSSQQNMVVRAKVGKRNAMGELPIDYAIETMQQTVKAPGIGEVSFDSVNPDKATDSPITPLLKAAAQAKWVMTLDRENRVLSVTGREKAIEGLDERLRDAFKASVDAEYLKKQAQGGFDRIPTRALKVGDTWELEETQRLEAGQSLTFNHRFQYLGEIELDGRKLHRIDVTATKVALAIEGNPAVKLAKSDLKPVKSTGTLMFDPAAGSIFSEKHSTQIKGTIVLSIGGQELPADLDLLIENSSTARR
jgi:hypothetical protein